MAASEKSWSGASRLDRLHFSIDDEDLIENIRPNLISLTPSDSCSTQLSPDKTFNDYELFPEGEQQHSARMVNSCHIGDSLDSSSDSIMFLLEEPAKAIPTGSRQELSSRECTGSSSHSEQTGTSQMKRNISRSLHDLRKVPPSLSKSNSQLSLGTAHSQSMLATSSVLRSKDSGFARSLSLLSLNSTGYEHVESKVRKYIKELKQESVAKRMHLRAGKQRCNSMGSVVSSRNPGSGENLHEIIEKLENDIEEKSKMLHAVQENYNTLLLKYAEAQNRIDKLRFQVLDSPAPAVKCTSDLAMATDKSVQVSERLFLGTKNETEDEPSRNNSTSCKYLVPMLDTLMESVSSNERIGAEQDGISLTKDKCPDPYARLPLCSTTPSVGSSVTESDPHSWTGLPVGATVLLLGSPPLNSDSYSSTKSPVTSTAPSIGSPAMKMHSNPKMRPLLTTTVPSIDCPLTSWIPEPETRHALPVSPPDPSAAITVLHHQAWITMPVTPTASAVCEVSQTLKSTTPVPSVSTPINMSCLHLWTPASVSTTVSPIGSAEETSHPVIPDTYTPSDIFHANVSHPLTTLSSSSVCSPVEKLIPDPLIATFSSSTDPIRKIVPHSWTATSMPTQQVIKPHPASIIPNISSSVISVATTVPSANPPIKKLHPGSWTEPEVTSDAPSFLFSGVDDFNILPCKTTVNSSTILSPVIKSGCMPVLSDVACETNRTETYSEFARVLEKPDGVKVSDNATSHEVYTAGSEAAGSPYSATKQVHELTSKTLKEYVEESLLEDCLLKVRRWQQTLPSCYGSLEGNVSPHIMKHSAVDSGHPQSELCNLSTKVNLDKKVKRTSVNPILSPSPADLHRMDVTEHPGGEIGHLHFHPCKCWQPDDYKSEGHCKSQTKAKPRRKIEDLPTNCLVPSLNFDGLFENTVAQSSSKSSPASVTSHVCIPQVIYLPCEHCPVQIPRVPCPRRKLKKILELHKNCSKSESSHNHFVRRKESKDVYLMKKLSSPPSIGTSTSYKSIQRKNIAEKGSVCNANGDGSDTEGTLPLLLRSLSSEMSWKMGGKKERKRRLEELDKLLSNWEHLHHQSKEDREQCSSPVVCEGNKSLDILTCLDDMDTVAKEIGSHSDSIIRFLTLQLDIPLPKIALN